MSAGGDDPTRPSLVTAGETMLRLAPPGEDGLETADSLAVRVGGAESNVAIAAARLGLDAAWTSVLPDSPLGRRVTGALRAHGVEPLVAWSDTGRQGTYYLERGPAPRQTTVVYDREGAPVREAAPDDLSLDRVRAADAVHVTGITPALSPTLARTTAELLATARDAGTTTTFDVNYRSKLWRATAARETLSDFLPLVDVLVVARRDAATVLEREGAAPAVAADLAAEYGAETVVVTRGDEGAVAFHDGTVHEQGAFPATSAHAVGTGDAFVGGFLARRLRGDAVPVALEYGTATAALKRSIPGDVAAVTPAEVERVVAGDGPNQERAVSR